MRPPVARATGGLFYEIKNRRGYNRGSNVYCHCKQRAKPPEKQKSKTVGADLRVCGKLKSYKGKANQQKGREK